jgi:hypothetical protein
MAGPLVLAKALNIADRAVVLRCPQSRACAPVKAERCVSALVQASRAGVSADFESVRHYSTFSKSFASPTDFRHSASLPAALRALARANTALTRSAALFSAAAMEAGVGS